MSWSINYYCRLSYDASNIYLSCLVKMTREEGGSSQRQSNVLTVIWQLRGPPPLLGTTLYIKGNLMICLSPCICFLLYDLLRLLPIATGILVWTWTWYIIGALKFPLSELMAMCIKWRVLSTCVGAEHTVLWSCSSLSRLLRTPSDACSPIKLLCWHVDVLAYLVVPLLPLFTSNFVLNRLLTLDATSAVYTVNTSGQQITKYWLRLSGVHVIRLGIAPFLLTGCNEIALACLTWINKPSSKPAWIQFYTVSGPSKAGLGDPITCLMYFACWPADVWKSES